MEKQGSGVSPVQSIALKMKVQALAWEIRDSTGKPVLVNLHNLIQSGIGKKVGFQKPGQ